MPKMLLRHAFKFIIYLKILLPTYNPVRCPVLRLGHVMLSVGNSSPLLEVICKKENADASTIDVAGTP